MPRITAGRVGFFVLLLIGVPCLVTIPWTLSGTEPETPIYYNAQRLEPRQAPGDAKDIRAKPLADGQQPTSWQPFGTDSLGRSLLSRCLLGGAVSLGIGIAAAFISVIIGVTWGALAGLAGGRVDSAMMRIVDVLYGLPYILLVVLITIALQPIIRNGLFELFGPAPGSTSGMSEATAEQIASLFTLLMAIGGLSWLTMARVIRGQVLSLRAQPFVEAARACGVGPFRILRVHLLPNLIGPIVVYTTLTVPTAILQESFLSSLGIGVQPPLPSWGNLAAEGVKELHTLALPGADFGWWLMLWPCLLLALTLLALNFLGEALRNRLDPRRLKT